jgi:hypothetical protein
MKYATDRHFSDSEKAARQLLDIIKVSIAESGQPHAYTGRTNTEFLRAGGSLAEYSAGRRYGAENNLFQIERSGTRFELLPDGAE